MNFIKRKNFFLIGFLIFLCNNFFAKEFTFDDAEKVRSDVVKKAKTFVGCPYKLGAIGPKEFDCSGLIFTTFRESASIQLPRTVKAMYSFVKIVPRDQLEEGDLIFFHTGSDNKINHAGIYIGRNQFIHAASDGANNGVIASSLTERYYKNAYAAVGKVITSSQKKTEDEIITEEEIPAENNEVEKKEKEPFQKQIVLDTILSCDWNLWMPKEFLINYRGFTWTTGARYTGWQVQPGIATTFRWNYGTDCFQLPILFTLNFNDYIGIYLGPVITFGNPHLPKSYKNSSNQNNQDSSAENSSIVNMNNSTPIVGSFFPGLIGISFTTPPIKIGKIKLSFCQDFIYTIYNRQDGGALSFGDSLQSGFVFSTGVKISLPLKEILK